MSALQIALLSAGAPGHEIIIPTPCWLDYPVYVHHVGGTPIMVAPERGTELDLNTVAAAVTKRTAPAWYSLRPIQTGRTNNLPPLNSLPPQFLTVGRNFEPTST